MTHDELSAILDTVPDVPFAYYQFNAQYAPDLPFGVFMRKSTETQKADGISVAKTSTYHIELYTDIKNPEIEAKLEKVLTDADIPFDIVQETYIDSEKMFEVVYEIIITE